MGKKDGKAIFSAMLMGKIWAENKISQLIFYLCQQILYISQTIPRYFAVIKIDNLEAVENVMALVKLFKTPNAVYSFDVSTSSLREINGRELQRIEASRKGRDSNTAYSNVNQYYYDTSAAANFTTESGA